METNHHPQVKICGLTHVQDALTCARHGADAVGFVFYPKSPRHVSRSRVRAICRALPPSVDRVGVFVNSPFSGIMSIAAHCRLTTVQLHGRESPELVSRLRREGLSVIKALFLGQFPKTENAVEYNASAFLIEYGKGRLPGGNAREWDYNRVVNFGHRHPFVLAGGLTPQNVRRAIHACSPDAVDVSSGVETKAGQKDFAGIKTFLHEVRDTNRPFPEMVRKPRRIFNATF